MKYLMHCGIVSEACKRQDIYGFRKKESAREREQTGNPRTRGPAKLGGK